MDWYRGSRVNDFLVPKDQDLLDRHPSLDCWSNWEISAIEGFNSPNNFFIMDFFDKSFNNQIELKSSLHDKDQSCSSSVCGGLPEQSFQQTALSCDQPNYQLQDLPTFVQMNDISPDSVPEDLPYVENRDKSLNISPENQCGNEPGGLQNDIAASELVSCDSESKDCLDVEAPPVKVLDSIDQCSRYDGMHEQSSHEEFILDDLGMVIGQFTERTRICFRDAMYRLARSSEQQHVLQDQEEHLNVQNEMLRSDHGETVRSQDKEAMESETNSIDRVIANLMFNNMEFNIHDPPLTPSVNSMQQIIGSKGLHGKCSEALNLAQKLPADAEVPKFGLTNQQRDTCSHFSCGSLSY